MNTKTLAPRALSVIDQYLHFKVGSAVCSVPYFNNRTVRARATLRTFVGKGSPKDIYDEVQVMLIRQHVPAETLADESLKKLLADADIGIDCSAFAYYVLNAESAETGRSPLDKHISFVNCTGLFGRMRAALRPAENCDVATFADDRNSRVIAMKDALPGDIITMMGDAEDNEHDHILIIHQVDQQNSVATKIFYSHAAAYPEDGLYGSGVKQGTIMITDPSKPIIAQEWSENGQTGPADQLFVRAQRSKTDVRRLNWF